MDQLGNELDVHSGLIMYHLLNCPICRCYFDNEENCFEHFLDHFENSKNFLFRRSNLVFWLNSYGRITPEKLTMTESLTEVEKEMKASNELTIPNTDHHAESKELQAYFCEICKESFPDEDQICVHNFIHVQVKVPAIELQLNCPLCDKYFCQDESCLMHIFTHINQGTRTDSSSTIQETFQFIKKWTIFFSNSEFFDSILSKYTRYKQRLNSTLLSKILWSEIKTVKNCKFCKTPVASVFDLLDNHRDCKPCNLIKSVFCVICNFKAPDMDTLMLHLFSDHVVCYCGHRGDDFDSFMKHSRECVAHKSGVICPCCQTENFVTEGAFKEHIEGSKRKSCGSHLKKNKWVCAICKKRCSQNDMFNHILMEHVSCLCGYKNEDLKSFFIHTADCVTKKSNIICPICRKTMCSTEAFLQQHVSRCLPWKKPERSELLDLSGGDKKVLKRKHERLIVETLSKKTKSNFKLDCVNCASQ